MQFAPQELQGGTLYGPKTRVGNWFNETVLQEERYAEFRKKKETGELAIGFRSHRFYICNQKVSQRTLQRVGGPSCLSRKDLIPHPSGAPYILSGW